MMMESTQAATRRSKSRSGVGRAFELNKPCFVYLAAHAAGQRFKIGLSIDPISRFQQLPEAGKIDLTVSLVRRLPSQGRAHQVERALHKALQPFRLAGLHQGAGCTEWFRMEAFSRASVFIDLMPDAAEPAHTLSRAWPQDRRNDYMRTAEANVTQTLGAISLWRLAAGQMPLRVCEQTKDTWLEFPGFKATSHLAATGLRATLLDIEGSYGLRLLRKTRTPASLIRLVSYAGPNGADLRIDLQRAPALNKLPGGARLIQHLQDGLGALRLESRSRMPSREPLSPAQINAGLGCLMEYRAEDAALEAQSLWE
jgi:hypothetical protein